MSGSPTLRPTRSRPGGVARGALFVLGLGGALAAGGAIRAAFLRPAQADEKAAEPRPRVERPEPLPAEPRTPDDLIRAGDFDDALRLIAALPKPAPDEARDRAYREALCLEALRRWKDADAAYLRADGLGATPSASARATLGRARCAAAGGDLRTARGLLDRVALGSGHPDCRGRRILDECLHLRACLRVLELGTRGTTDPLDPDALARVPLGIAGGDYLDWLPTGTITLPDPNEDVEPGTVRVTTSTDEAGVTAHLAEQPTVAQVRAIGGAAGLTVRVSDEAASLLAVAVAVRVERAPLAEVLTALTDSAGATWKIDAGVLTVEPARSSDAAARRAPAADALRRALAVAPDHPAAHAARVELGNVEAGRGRWREAVKEYRRVLDGSPNAAEALPAAYNLGLIDLRHGNFRAARARFLEVIDRATDARWSELGRWWVGRTHLDAGETEEARQSFAAGLGGRTKDVTGAAALGVCACDLIDGNDASARRVLRDYRIGSGDAHTALAALFESLLRYRVAPSEGRREALAGAVRDAGEARAMGLAGVVLAGDVYRDLGFEDRMAEVYEAAAETARGPLAHRMTFRVAERFDSLDERVKARQRYLAVAATDPGPLGARAELRVAELAARDGRGDECVRRCRGLVGRAGVEPEALLAVLGRGYELQGNYRLAAECFAGRTPSE